MLLILSHLLHLAVAIRIVFDDDDDDDDDDSGEW